MIKASLNREDEQAYRLHHLRQDSRILIFFYGVSILFNLLSIPVDQLIVGDGNRFNWLVVDRLLMVTLSFGALRVAHRPRNLRLYDATALGWGIVIALLYLPIQFTRPPTYVYNTLLDLIVVMGMYVVMPDRPRLRFLPALAYSAVSLFGVFILRTQLDHLTQWYILLSFIALNLGGFLVGHMIFNARRMVWHSALELARVARERTELLEMKNRLMSTLSHEVRTPLNIITSSANLLDGYLESLDSRQRRAVLERLMIGSTRLTEILERLFHLHWGQETRMNRHLEKKDVSAWVKRVTQECQGLYPDCEIRATLKGPARSRPLDPFLLWLIVSNLLANACKFAPQAARRLFLILDETGIQIRVEDDGPGIDPRDQHKVFDPFYRSTGTRTLEGSGMGLSLVREAVELLEGSVELTSRPGVTCFTVQLPWLKTD